MADPEGPEREARYANAFEVGFNAYEFIIDFAQQYDRGSHRVHTRIVTSPDLARGLSELLESSLRQYAGRYQTGEISE
jgi:hypothetical protein